MRRMFQISDNKANTKYNSTSRCQLMLVVTLGTQLRMFTSFFKDICIMNLLLSYFTLGTKVADKNWDAFASNHYIESLITI